MKYMEVICNAFSSMKIDFEGSKSVTGSDCPGQGSNQRAISLPELSLPGLQCHKIDISCCDAWTPERLQLVNQKRHLPESFHQKI